MPNGGQELARYRYKPNMNDDHQDTLSTKYPCSSWVIDLYLTATCLSSQKQHKHYDELLSLWQFKYIPVFHKVTTFLVFQSKFIVFLYTLGYDAYSDMPLWTAHGDSLTAFFWRHRANTHNDLDGFPGRNLRGKISHQISITHCPATVPFSGRLWRWMESRWCVVPYDLDFFPLQ